MAPRIAVSDAARAAALIIAQPPLPAIGAAAPVPAAIPPALFALEAASSLAHFSATNKDKNLQLVQTIGAAILRRCSDSGAHSRPEQPRSGCSLALVQSAPEQLLSPEHCPQHQIFRINSNQA
jgi:hypothetical protein